MICLSPMRLGSTVYVMVRERCMFASDKERRMDDIHRASRCGRCVLGCCKIGSEIPALHCAQDRAMRSIFEIMEFVRQCLMNNWICPSPCRTFHGIIPHPPYVVGQKRMGLAVFRLKPFLATMMGSDLALAWSRTCGGKKHWGSTYLRLAQ